MQSIANTRGLVPPNIQALFERARVNVPDLVQVVYEPLYDYKAWAAATTTSRFFVEPVGTGGTKTGADTNLELSGQLSKGQAFAVTGIQVELYPGVTINGTDASDFADDVYRFYQNGQLVFKIGDKEIIKQGNLMKFAPVNRLGQDSATTVATDRYVYAVAAGREFAVNDVLLESNQNFSVELRNVNALPSGSAARVGITLNGYKFRNAQ